MPNGDRLRERLAALASGETEAAVPRLASTVMLLRDAVLDGPEGELPDGPGVEVFVQRRVASMEFAASMVVFPGGGVDPRDAEGTLPWAGPSPVEWAARLGTSEPDAQVLVAAAVREVFEECGILLAGPTDDTVVGDVSGEQWQQRRQALLSRERSLSEVLAESGLLLRSDLLSYRAHWITPEAETRRYDTYFFAALAPEGQIADDATTEADLADWITPSWLLELADADRAKVMPPTRVNLEELALAPDAATLVAEQVEVLTVAPTFLITEAGVVIRTER